MRIMALEEDDMELPNDLPDVRYQRLGTAGFDEIFTMDADDLLKKRYLSLNE